MQQDQLGNTALSTKTKCTTFIDELLKAIPELAPGWIYYTPGPRQIGDFARAKDTLSVIIVEIDTRIYKTYPELDLTIVPQLSERYYEFNL